MSASSGSAQKPSVSVLTPTIPSREDLLRQCMASVACSWHMKVANVDHIIEADADREGCSVTINRCARRARGDWLIPLADDDLILPGAISALLTASEDADVVYSPPLVTGNEDRWWFFQTPPAIPSFGLIRRTLWEELGGYDETLQHEEDRDFWTRALEVGAQFVRVDDPCWVYRQHGGNKSFNKQPVAA